ncbi:MAG: DUF4440 domain-containing protein, partial [bacterium]|nr:DUF4440 domain-containing protein [bacterium]
EHAAVAEVHAVVDAFHRAAAQADEEGYFALLAPAAVFLGTDAGERWPKEEFRAFAHPHFAAGRGWTFTPQKRQVTIAGDGQTAWFDESLASASYGECRGTGVLQRLEGVWKIEQYNLTIPIPNDLAKEFVARIREAQTPPEASPGEASPESYLGQAPPGHTAERFAPGVVSTEAIEFAPAFAPDATELYFTRFDASFRGILMVMKREGDGWTAPQPAPFSGRYADGSSSFSPDGKRLFFQSKRPAAGTDEPREHFALWVVERTEAGWSEPRDLVLPVESLAGEWNPSVTADGTVYFNATYSEETGGEGIFLSRLENGRYTMPERVGDSVTAAGTVEVEPCIAPDESFLIFYSAGRADNLSPQGNSGDLYIRFRNSDGTWTPARNLGERVNSTAEENWPRLSPDGGYLFFSSNRASENGFPDIYWINAQIIEELRAVD